MKWFVTMTDRFLSGWGQAKGKDAKLVIGPMSYDDAIRIDRAARRRSEMKYVNIREAKGNPRNFYPRSQVTVKKLSEMGGSWTSDSFFRKKK